MERRNKSLIKRNAIENLIKAGVFDFEEPNRQILMHKLDQSYRTKTQIKEGYECPLREFDKMQWEKESLGMFLTEHPLEKYAFKHITEFSEGTNCLVAGIVESVNPFYDKNGNEMAFATISNQYDNIKLIIFTKTWRSKANELPSKVICGNIIMVNGKRSGNDVLVDNITVIDKI